MKKQLLFMFSLAVLVIAVSCHRQTAPTISTRTDIPAPPAPEPTSTASTDMEAGRQIYTSKCIRCHQAKPVANWTVDEWQPILRSMIHKAKLDSLEGQQVTVYVNANAKR